jgi:orotidine-5'-phosphate decarboxylase
MNQKLKWNPLIVALDVPDGDQALDLVNQLRGNIEIFKVGLQLFTTEGPSIVQRINAQGCKVFLDLKLHDIPNTVANAVTSAASLGVHMLTLHTSGGIKMMKMARAAANAWAENHGGSCPKLLGVTMLTSLDEQQVQDVGYGYPVEDLVVRLARLAQQSGLDGVVCSQQELDRLSTETLPDLFFVTPGIRSSNAPSDDQARTKTAGEAVSAGARYLVVGRPITKAVDPTLAARELLKEIVTAKM